MNGLFGICLVVGIVALIAWILLGGLSEANDGRPKHPDERFGAPGRAAVASLTAFGMAGLSSSYGGWPRWAVVPAALVAAIVFGFYAYRYNPADDADAG